MSAIIRTPVLIVHRQALICAALSCLIGAWPEIGRVGEAADLAEALAAISIEQPGLILLDTDEHADFASTTISALHSASRAHILLLCGGNNHLAQRRALLKGAMGLVCKEKPPEVLHKAIQCVLAGEIWIDRTVAAQVLTDLVVGASESYSINSNRIGMLTKRERQVVTLIGEGLKNKQIAHRLAISEPTVRHHLTSIFEKLGVKNRLELVIFAHRYNLSTPGREALTTG